jgi:hypothetical protein
MKILMSLCNEWLNDNLDKVLYLTPDYDEPLLTNVDVTASTDITPSELNIMLLQTTNTAYARSRKEAYDLLNQFEMMTDDASNGTTTHAEAIAAIKLSHPKP